MSPDRRARGGGSGSRHRWPPDWDRHHDEFDDEPQAAAGQLEDDSPSDVLDVGDQGIDEFGEQRAADVGWRGEMAEDQFYEPADYSATDLPSRFDISMYRNGLFGGPGADLFGHHGFSDEESEARFVDEPQAGLVEWDDHPSAPQVPVQVPGPAHAPPPPPPDPVTETGSLVRPYTRTGGRTRSDYDLPIEALVSTSDRGWELEGVQLPEHRAICDLCVDAKSVAEVAALLRLPLGVVRVLIGDMAGMGLVVIHPVGGVVGDRPSMEFLERVLSGLRRL